ncbi:MAG: hypothetical protein JW787_04265 [Sedimentisphaerales bacterium]|nr:hypothetical protein [Sedimentisphaerales bacterium]
MKYSNILFSPLPVINTADILEYRDSSNFEITVHKLRRMGEKPVLFMKEQKRARHYIEKI